MINISNYIKESIFDNPEEIAKKDIKYSLSDLLIRMRNSKTFDELKQYVNEFTELLKKSAKRLRNHNDYLGDGYYISIYTKNNICITIDNEKHTYSYSIAMGVNDTDPNNIWVNYGTSFKHFAPSVDYCFFIPYKEGKEQMNIFADELAKINTRIADKIR